ncbi:MAG TPA: EVE domain-containing protein [Kiritimatiellia bacterium]|nr:EVE domain-containing protein [Kiritimatiellia bacterium]
MAPPPLQHWLMKSEPDVYSIDDLARDGRTPWTGVRNYQARNFMRDRMRVGDLVFFYHSSTEPPGIAGMGRVAGGAYPDPSQFDPKSEYFEPRATRDAPVWMLVDIAFERKFSRLIPLDALRADPALTGLLVLKKGQRLSVQPVEARHARRIIHLAGLSSART